MLETIGYLVWSKNWVIGWQRMNEAEQGDSQQIDKGLESQAKEFGYYLLQAECLPRYEQTWESINMFRFKKRYQWFASFTEGGEGECRSNVGCCVCLQNECMTSAQDILMPITMEY